MNLHPLPVGTTRDPLDALIDVMARKVMAISKGDGDAKTKAKAILELLKKQDKLMAILQEPESEDKPSPGFPKPSSTPESSSYRRYTTESFVGRVTAPRRSESAFDRVIREHMENIDAKFKGSQRHFTESASSSYKSFAERVTG